jgi:hypothetical protein
MFRGTEAVSAFVAMDEKSKTSPGGQARFLATVVGQLGFDQRMQTPMLQVSAVKSYELIH